MCGGPGEQASQWPLQPVAWCTWAHLMLSLEQEQAGEPCGGSCGTRVLPVAACQALYMDTLISSSQLLCGVQRLTWM